MTWRISNKIKCIGGKNMPRQKYLKNNHHMAFSFSTFRKKKTTITKLKTLFCISAFQLYISVKVWEISKNKLIGRDFETWEQQVEPFRKIRWITLSSWKRMQHLSYFYQPVRSDRKFLLSKQPLIFHYTTKVAKYILPPY